MPAGVEVLTQGVGYGILVGIGAFFALMMLVLTHLQNRFTAYSTHASEEFSTASRSVKPGLITAGIVSSWTWSATLLTSSTFAYSYGIAGPMWYACTGTSQVLLFALIAVQIKTHAPGAHTFPEMVLARHGRTAHLTYLFFGWATNMLVGACLVLGGSQVVAALSGVNVYAACFVIPVVVGAYVVAGGLRSTFVADYAHTIILFVAILVFCFQMYVPSPAGGRERGIDVFYDRLLAAGRDRPIAGNAHAGSYLTFKSNEGLVFAIDLLVAGFSTVWLDQAYWQRAIASRPESCVQAYLLGGLAWYGIPFGFGTAMGLGCAALTGDPSFPTFPHPLSAAQNGAGLSSPATAIALLGRGGAGLLLLLLFMAVTSSTSAELIAVSSLVTFDVYKTYLRPRATSRELVRMSHLAIVGFGFVLAAFCCLLNAVHIDLTWLLTVLGIIVGGASVPVGLVLLWPPLSTVAALCAPWVGTAAAIVVWMVVTHARSGSIGIGTLGDVTNAVAGNLTSSGVGVVMAFLLSYLFPGRWGKEGGDESQSRSRRPEAQPGDGGDAVITGVQPGGNGNGSGSGSGSGVDEEMGIERKEETTTATDAAEKTMATATATTTTPTTTTATITDPPSDPAPDTIVPTGNAVVDFLEASHAAPMDPELARKATRLALWFNLAYWLIVIVLVPFTFFGTEWEFTRAGFRGWCVVSFMWVWCSACICILWPLWESRGTIWAIAKGIVGKKSKS